MENPLQFYSRLSEVNGRRAKPGPVSLLIYVGDATEEGRFRRVAGVDHAVGFHAGYEDEILRANPFFFDLLVRLAIMGVDNQPERCIKKVQILG